MSISVFFEELESRINALEANQATQDSRLIACDKLLGKEMSDQMGHIKKLGDIVEALAVKLQDSEHAVLILSQNAETLNNKVDGIAYDAEALNNKVDGISSASDHTSSFLCDESNRIDDVVSKVDDIDYDIDQTPTALGDLSDRIEELEVNLSLLMEDLSSKAKVSIREPVVITKAIASPDLVQKKISTPKSSRAREVLSISKQSPETRYDVTESGISKEDFKKSLNRALSLSKLTEHQKVLKKL